MSLSALLKATRDHLRNQVPLTDFQCDMMPDGQPKPGVGDLFVAIHPTDWSTGGAAHIGLVESYGITCTISQRSPKIPPRKWMGELFFNSVSGIEKFARLIMLNLHLNYTVLHNANTLLDGSDLMVEPLRWNSNDPVPRPVDGSWFHAKPDALAGLVLDVNFGGVIRPQDSTRWE